MLVDIMLAMLAIEFTLWAGTWFRVRLLEDQIAALQRAVVALGTQQDCDD